MGSPKRKVEELEPDGVDVGERWATTGGTGLALASGRKIAWFTFKNAAGRSTAAERALLAAQAPLMYEALLDLVSGMRQDGSLVKSDGTPFEGHRAGCGCGVCQAMLALALAENGGRCILCACTEDDACVSGFGEGCAWEPLPGGAQLLCTAHPPKVLEAARRFIARGCHDGPEHVSKPIARALAKLAPGGSK